MSNKKAVAYSDEKQINRSLVENKGLEGPREHFRVEHPFSILGMKMPIFIICNHVRGTGNMGCRKPRYVM